MTDDLDTRRRRAAYRAAHRGTKEMDVLLGRYAEARLTGLDGEALSAFERILAAGDPELQGWIFAGAGLTGSEFAELIGDIRRFHGLGQGLDTASAVTS